MNSFPNSILTVAGFALGFGLVAAANSAPAQAIGIFESAADIGKIDLKGSSTFLPDKNQ